MSKIPQEIVNAAIRFMRTVQEYSNISDEQVEQMFDAFDPALKHQILMSFLRFSRTLRVETTASRKKIEAIKEVRAVTGWGLKEAKDLVEAAEQESGVVLPAEFNYDTVLKLSKGLENTGYKVY